MDSAKKKELEAIRKEALDVHEKVREHKQRALEDYSSSRRLDIGQFRNFIVQISIISFGAVGFSLPILDNSEFVKTIPLFISGLLLLTISAICGLWYSAFRIEDSIISSYKDWNTHKKLVQKILDIQLFLRNNPDKYDEYQRMMQKEIADEEKSLSDDIKKEIPRRDKITYFLIGFLSLGILLIFLSLFKISISF